MPSWLTVECERDVHVVPIGDTIRHDYDDDCPCGPTPEYINPDTGLSYPGGAVVVHHSLDGREAHE